MATTLTATFDTRREAEMTVERLVQEHGIDRADIFIATEGAENTAGISPDEMDEEVAAPPRNDASLNGGVTVAVDLPDEAAADKVKDAFVEFNSAGVVEN